jgi:molybdopterin/thiamine biosynthesis adenylyltransferase
MDQPFAYESAFARNVGWVTAPEQQRLRRARVAIAGVGGVGGLHALTLARLGVGGFHLADPDVFELANFNRQVGATLATIGQRKADVIARMVREVNPEVAPVVFADGVDARNLDAFLRGVDLYVDGLDFFALDVRARVFARCAELGIPAVTAAPIGMGAAYLVFVPGGVTFEQHFRLAGLAPERAYVRFLVGLAPRGLARGTLVDPSQVDLPNRRGPSTAVACHLCAAAVGTEAIKLLLGRGRVYAAPYYHQLDLYTGRWVRGWLPGGNHHPLQRLREALAARTYGAHRIARATSARAPAAPASGASDGARGAAP